MDQLPNQFFENIIRNVLAFSRNFITMLDLLIINDDALGYGSSLLKAFKKIGVSTDLLAFNERGVSGKIRKMFFQKSFQSSLLRKIINKKPSTVLFLCGEININKTELQILKSKGVSTGIWLYDDLYKYENIQQLLVEFDFILSFNQSDVKDIKTKYNKKCNYMPLFYDDNIFYEQDSTSNDNRFLISFIGSVHGPNYCGRREVIDKLLKLYCRERFYLCAGYSFWNLLKIIRDFRVVIGQFTHTRFVNLSMKSVGEIYRDSDFVLNVNGYSTRSRKSV